MSSKWQGELDEREQAMREAITAWLVLFGSSWVEWDTAWPNAFGMTRFTGLLSEAKHRDLYEFHPMRRNLARISETGIKYLQEKENDSSKQD